MQQAESGLPANWEVRHSRSKNIPYFFDVTTVQSQWEPPEGTDIDRLKNFIAAYTNAQVDVQPNQPVQKIRSEGKPQQKGDTAGQPAPAVQDPTQPIRAAHLLIKHEGSRNASSWKEPKITRKRKEAIAILEEHERRIRAGETTLRDLAATESDCASHSKAGDLGPFVFSRMQRPFAEAAYALEVGELSGIVETDSGVHLIQRLPLE